MATLKDALEAARTYLNDDAGLVWSDAALIPKLKEAHRELQTMLWACGSPAVRKQSPVAILVPSGQTDLGASQPIDMLTPFKLVEFGNSGSLATATDMTEVFFLPNKGPAVTLQYWAWKEEKITFLGASADSNVVVYYRKNIAIPVVATDPIGILFGELYLGARAAAVAHGSLGNAAAYNIVTQFAGENFKKVVDAQRGQQTPPMKP